MFCVILEARIMNYFENKILKDKLFVKSWKGIFISEKIPTFAGILLSLPYEL